MTLTFDHLPERDSVLRRLDPRWKLAALVPAALVVAGLRTLPALGVACAGSLALAALGRLPARWLLRRLGGIALVVCLFAAFLPFLPAAGPVWDVGPVRLHQHGLEAAARLCLKVVTLLTLALVLWATGPPAETFKAARALRVPGVFIQLTLLTYRYLFLLAEELGRLRTALRVRGYRNRPNLHSYRTVGHVAGTLLVRSYERAERVGQAMRCRGFDGQFRSLAAARTRAADVLFFAALTGAAAGLLIWDLLPQ